MNVQKVIFSLTLRVDKDFISSLRSENKLFDEVKNKTWNMSPAEDVTYVIYIIQGEDFPCETFNSEQFFRISV